MSKKDNFQTAVKKVIIECDYIYLNVKLLDNQNLETQKVLNNLEQARVWSSKLLNLFSEPIPDMPDSVTLPKVGDFENLKFFKKIMENLLIMFISKDYDGAVVLQNALQFFIAYNNIYINLKEVIPNLESAKDLVK